MVIRGEDLRPSKFIRPENGRNPSALSCPGSSKSSSRRERERERAHATVSFRSRAIEFQPFLLLFPSPLIIFVDHRIIVSEGAEKKKLVDDDRRWITFASFSPRFKNTEKANELGGSKFHTRTGDSLVFLLISGAREKRRGSIFFFAGSDSFCNGDKWMNARFIHLLTTFVPRR